MTSPRSRRSSKLPKGATVPAGPVNGGEFVDMVIASCVPTVPGRERRLRCGAVPFLATLPRRVAVYSKWQLGASQPTCLAPRNKRFVAHRLLACSWACASLRWVAHRCAGLRGGWGDLNNLG